MEQENTFNNQGSVYNLEKALKKKNPFRNTWHRCIVNIVFTNGWVCEKVKDHFAPFGLTMKQYNVLRILNGADTPLTTSAIRDRMIERGSDTSRIVERLHKKGLVHRSICPSDKRLVDVTISKKGIALVDEVANHSSKLDEIVNNKLTEEESIQLNNILDKLRS
ncbi:MAG: MarR family transcriptional regulator [Bacteroidota bacterium]